MTNVLIVIGLASLMAMIAILLKHHVAESQSPKEVYEKPKRAPDIPIVMERIQRWRSEGKISREEYEHLLYLCQEEKGGDDPFD